MISDGRLVAQGTLAEVQRAGTMTAEVETGEPAAAAEVLAGLGLTEVMPRGARVTAVVGDVEPERIVAALVAAGVGVRGFAVRRPSLEDVFVGLTGEGFDVHR